jgi:ubiquinone/menaquinone biosynthesis C-methylase UbiE
MHAKTIETQATQSKTSQPNREVIANPMHRAIAWLAGGIFILGFFLPLVGAWTGPVLAVWFVGTQKPRRGFLWLLAFSLVPALAFGWRKFPLAEPLPAVEFLGWSLVFAVLGILPLTFHRLTSPRLPGLLSTLPFPMAAVVLQALVLPWVPTGVFDRGGLIQSQHGNIVPMEAGALLGISALVFLVDWFAATVVWMWNNEFRASRIRAGVSLAGAVWVLVGVAALFRMFSGGPVPTTLPAGITFSWVCLGGIAAASVYALLNPIGSRPWAARLEALARLQSPATGEPLHVVEEQRRETLVSTSGERFPVHHGIPAFVKPEDFTGDNGKYNHLYETIGGFYDDTQRFFGAFRGLSLDSYFMNYMGLLDVKPGDSVLETSVGTGLNFKYLPQGVKLSGLDLSAEMLANCQANLRRWGMDGDLYLGNAESLPFADASFDVVYTAGAFNFFTDRPKAVREMIRVAKPGAQLMIEDETEEYVKATYENIPFTSSFYKDRKESVKVPIDLVPAEMEDVHLEMLKDGKFYAITFRKPLQPVTP